MLENLLQFPDSKLGIKSCGGGLHSVHVLVEGRKLEFCVGFILVFQLLRVKCSHRRSQPLQIKMTIEIENIHYIQTILRIFIV